MIEVRIRAQFDLLVLDLNNLGNLNNEHKKKNTLKHFLKFIQIYRKYTEYRLILEIECIRIHNLNLNRSFDTVENFTSASFQFVIVSIRIVGMDCFLVRGVNL